MNATDSDHVPAFTGAESVPVRCAWYVTAENSFVALALTAMVLLPLIDILLRKFFHGGLGSTAPIVQHLTLVVGMAGGALAARDRRLLALATTGWLKGNFAIGARWFSRTVAALVAVALAVASVRFVAAERPAGEILAVHIPVWIVQCVLPVGFALIGVRLFWQTSDRWSYRLLAVALIGAVLALGYWPPVAVHALVLPALILLAIATALGTPIFAALGGVGLVLFLGDELPIASMPVEHYRLTVNPALPSIPLFTLAGFILAEGGAARRLLRVFQELCGWFRGGPAIVVTLICAFFTAFTGGSGVTILALAALLLPMLRAAKFSERDALGLLTGAGSLGVVLPPCLPVILYAIVARVDMRAMFLGGLAPGVLLIVLTAAWGIWSGRRAGAVETKFDLGALGRAAWAAKWELLLPVVSLAALFGGWATPVETAALTAAGAFAIEFLVHRDLRLLRDGPRVAAEAGLLVGGVLLILGVALGLTNYLIDAMVPDQLAAWAAAHVHSRWLFLLGLNVVLIIVGGLIEIYAATVVVVPLLVPIGAQLGIDPVHLGIIFLANMELGFLAPPIGLNLLLASYRLEKPVAEVTRATLPLLFVMFLGVLLITYFAPLTTTLPRLFASP